MFLILALLTLTTPVWSMTQLQAAEGANVTLQWDGPVKVEPSTLILYCFLKTPPQKIMLEVAEGEQTPGPTGGQFTGRVWWDREALGLGQVRVVLTRVSAQDQGVYWCYMYANYQPQDGHWAHHSHEYFMLNVTRDKHDSEDRPPEVLKDRFPESDLSLFQKVLLCLIFVVMTVMASCIALTWTVLQLTRTKTLLLPV